MEEAISVKGAVHYLNRFVLWLIALMGAITLMAVLWLLSSMANTNTRLAVIESKQPTIKETAEIAAEVKARLDVIESNRFTAKDAMDLVETLRRDMNTRLGEVTSELRDLKKEAH